jgi:hypothetical protein
MLASFNVYYDVTPCYNDGDMSSRVEAWLIRKVRVDVDEDAAEMTFFNYDHFLQYVMPTMFSP